METDDILSNSHFFMNFSALCWKRICGSRRSLSENVLCWKLSSQNLRFPFNIKMFLLNRSFSFFDWFLNPDTCTLQVTQTA